MLTEYRKNHGHAPFPISPSRGIVVMKTEVKGEETPLRVLVIGDSLAAGVGTSHSGTPVLPESIARGLSQSLGRAVSWTCVGTPGASSAQIVQAILTMEDSPNIMEKKLIEWQATGRRAQEWLQQLIQRDDVSGRLDDLQRAEDGGNRIQLWWGKIRKNITDFRVNVVEKHADENDALTKRLLLERRLVRRESIQVDPEQFDIAVVLTGLNDIKFAFLPFMMERSNLRNLQGIPKATPGEGLRSELQRVLVALKSRMNLDLSEEEKESKESRSVKQPLPSALAMSPLKKQGRGPLVVFPAMPAEPIPLFQRAPLSWFLIPLINMMDANKKYLADRYPDMVLYVESPSNETIRRFERGEGPLFAARTAEQILVTVTDVTEQAKRRVEDLMQKHYQRWTTDRERDDHEQSCSSRDAFSQQCHDHLPPRKLTNPGSTMMSPDRVHPNDNGYDFWGRHIAAAIVKEWQKDPASA
jgi:lysophospholipase L1-like esterase